MKTVKIERTTQKGINGSKGVEIKAKFVDEMKSHLTFEKLAFTKTLSMFDNSLDEKGEWDCDGVFVQEQDVPKLIQFLAEAFPLEFYKEVNRRNKLQASELMANNVCVL